MAAMGDPAGKVGFSISPRSTFLQEPSYNTNMEIEQLLSKINALENCVMELAHAIEVLVEAHNHHAVDIRIEKARSFNGAIGIPPFPESVSIDITQSKSI